MKKAGLVAAAVAAAAIAVPTAAAKPDNPHSQGAAHANEHSSHHATDPSALVTSNGKAKVMYVFKGSYVDATTVDVAKGNNHVRRAELSGPVSFDFATAKVSVADTNDDGASDLADVAAGDKVVVKVKAPKGAIGVQPFVARQLVDQTSPAVD
jgi:hypothetical protein